MSFQFNRPNFHYSGNSPRDLSGGSQFSGTFTTPDGKTDITPSFSHYGTIGGPSSYGAGVDVTHRPNPATSVGVGGYTQGGDHGVNVNVKIEF